MAHKKTNPHRGPTWEGYFPRRTKTLVEKKRAADRKQKQKGWQ
jgi:hypothetical protein